MSVLEGIISAVKDIVRCIIVDNITVENRMLNASINTICTIILNVLISPLVLYIIWRRFRPNDMSLYTDVDFTNHRQMTWEISKNKAFHDRITKMLQTKFKLRKTYAYSYSSEKNAIIGIYDRYDADEGGYHQHTYLDIPEKITPIYSKNNHVIGISCVLETLRIAYDDDNTLFEFLNMFRDKKETSVNTNALYVYDDSLLDDNEEPIKSIIYTNYTFDNYISNSIDNVRKLVTEFKRVNATGSIYESSNNYNLGIMLYGEPGTGKTLLVKTICVELKQSARIFKLHKMKTPTQLILKLNKCVARNEIIIFDEFDFDASLISRSEHKDTDYIRELISRKTKLLTSPQASSDHVADEVKNIGKEIKLYENRLSIDTIITALDGMHEQRGRVVIACTNRIDKIDSALLRPGRFDIVQELTAYNSTEVAMYLTKFYKTEISGNFKPITPANLRHLCKCNMLDDVLKKLTN